MSDKDVKMLVTSQFGWKLALRDKKLAGGVGAPSLTPSRPTENSPQSQNLQGDFRQYTHSYVCVCLRLFLCPLYNEYN